MLIRTLLGSSLLISTTLANAEEPAMSRLFVGTYTNGASKGVYTSTLDLGTGTLSEPLLAGEVKNPSFLALHPSLPVLYAVGENYDKGGGAISAFAFEKSGGKLTLLNNLPSGGAGPCYVAISPDAKTAMLANYGGGSVSSYSLNEDGSLKSLASTLKHEGSSVNPQRQKEPHAHSILPTADGLYAMAADLGTDEIWVYSVDPASSKLTLVRKNKVAPGAGPRHMAFSKAGVAYVVNELANTVDTYRISKAEGSLQLVGTTPTLPADFKEPSTTAEIAVHPSDRFVYCSNRGHDSISVFVVGADHTLTLVETTPTQGKTPRHFAIDPTGQFLIAANQKSDTLVVFRIDKETGKLTPTGSTITVAAPVCVRFVK
jgi:6-phosphogluconolactonase